MGDLSNTKISPDHMKTMVGHYSTVIDKLSTQAAANWLVRTFPVIGMEEKEATNEYLRLIKRMKLTNHLVGK